MGPGPKILGPTGSSGCGYDVNIVPTSIHPPTEDSLTRISLDEKNLVFSLLYKATLNLHMSLDDYLHKNGSNKYIHHTISFLILFDKGFRCFK